MKFSVCVEALFSGKDFYESLKTVKDLGLDNIEFWSWWNKDIKRIKHEVDSLGLNVAAFCTGFISLTDPQKSDEYVEFLKKSIEVAKELGCKFLISQVGDELEGVSREDQHNSIVDGLKVCAPMLEEEGITLVIEPLNTHVNHKGYYLYSSHEAFEIVDKVGSGNVKVLYDIYHQQIMEGNLISTIRNNIDKIGYFHAAGNPGRNELYYGEINYMEVLKAIRETGYNGYIGLEYFPKDDVKKGLEMLKNL